MSLLVSPERVFWRRREAQARGAAPARILTYPPCRTDSHILTRLTQAKELGEFITVNGQSQSNLLRCIALSPRFAHTLPTMQRSRLVSLPEARRPTPASRRPTRTSRSTAREPPRRPRRRSCSCAARWQHTFRVTLSSASFYLAVLRAPRASQELTRPCPFCARANLQGHRRPWYLSKKLNCHCRSLCQDTSRTASKGENDSTVSLSGPARLNVPSSSSRSPHLDRIERSPREIRVVGLDRG